MADYKVEVGVKGGQKAARYLANLATKLGGKKFVKVGFFEDAMYPAGDTKRFFKGLALHTGTKSTQPPKPVAGLHVAQVAAWNNFGNSRVPPRPFFSNMVRDESPKWGKKLAAVLKAANNDTTVALNLMGEGIQDQLVAAIVKWPRDNAPLTVAIKGFNHGLIDTGVMQRAVGYQVTK